jgi:hypothetical protein
MKFVKLVSKNNGDWNTSRNRIDMTIPASLGVVDLQKSYLMLETELTSNQLDNVCLGNGVDEYRSDCLIKNARISNDKVGVIEERIEHNVLQENLNAFVLNEDKQSAEAYAQGGVSKDRFAFKYSAFRDLKRQGSVLSTKKSTELVIPLKRLFGVCEEQEFPIITGDLDIMIELEDTRSIVKQNITYTNASKLNLEDKLAGTHTTGTVLDARNHGLFVGAVVILNCDVNGSPLAAVETTITQLSLDDATGTLTITFADEYGGGEHAVDNITLYEKESQNLDWVIRQAHVIVLQNVLTLPKIEPIQFPTWSLERINLPATLDFQRQYEIEPLCSGAMLLMPSATNLLSKQDDMTNYRFLVDGKVKTDRVVPSNSKLDLDQKIQGLTNMGEMIYDLTNTEVKTPMLSLQEENKRLLLQANVKFNPACSAGVAYLYKKVEKVLTF